MITQTLTYTMMKLPKIATIAFLLSVICIQAHSTNYYVDALTGSNTYDGTSPAKAWKTLSKVDSMSYAPGDVIAFQGGQTFNGNFNIKNNGDSTALIKFTSYGTGQAKINAGTETAISCYNRGYIWIDNLNIYGGWNSTTQTGSNGGGIYFFNDLYKGVKLGTVKITNCEISGFYGAGSHYGGGIVISSWTNDGSSSGYKDIEITNNSVHDNGMGGIGIVGQYVSKGDTVYSFPSVYVGYNKVYNNLGVKNYTSQFSGNGIVISQVSGGTIEHNTTYNNGWLMGSTGAGPCGCWIWDCKNVVMQYNESYKNGTPKGRNDGEGFDFDGGVVNCVMQYNYAHDNHSCGILVCEFGNSRCSNANNIIRYNILEINNSPKSTSCEIAVSSFGGTVSNALIHNNTVYADSSTCAYDDATSSKYFNNIFYSKAKLPIISASNPSALFLNNCYYNTIGTTYKFNNTTYSSLANFRVSTNNETLTSVTYGYELDPLFSSGGYGGTVGTNSPNTLTNYCLTPASPLVDKGYDLTKSGFKNGATDFNLINIPSNGPFCIGACTQTKSSGLKEINASSNFDLFPNPAKDFVTVATQTDDVKHIRLIDMNGKTILQSEMTNNLVMNVSAINNGVYLFNYQSKSDSQSKKLIIRR